MLKDKLNAYSNTDAKSQNLGNNAMQQIVSASYLNHKRLYLLVQACNLKTEKQWMKVLN